MDLGDSQLQPVRLLGEGGFGRVFLCKCRHSKPERYVCVKRIIVHNPRAEMKMIEEEVYIISQLKHPRIVQFIRSYVHAITVNIVMEYVPNGTIRSIIDQCLCRSAMPAALPAAQLLHYFCDILMGLEYLHIRHVIHRDVKPENLLVDGRGRIKITDFGISAIHSPSKQHLNASGTPHYMAPEVMRGGKFDFKSDIWSLGCVLYEMCVGQSPFHQAQNLTDLKYLVFVLSRPKFECHQKINAYYGDIWSNLCERMLTYDMQKRISLPEIVRLDPLITIPYYQQYFEYDY